jgi:hypothetical protein
MPQVMGQLKILGVESHYGSYRPYPNDGSCRETPMEPIKFPFRPKSMSKKPKL